MPNLIITIGREYGSGGRLIGEKIAKELGIPLYDKEIIEKAAQACGVPPALAFEVDEKPTNSLLYNIMLKDKANSPQNTTLSQDNFIKQQCQIIQELATKESCVIVGRCADYILRKEEKCVNVFITSTMQDKVIRVINTYKEPEKGVTNLITRTDKARATYYTYMTGRKWGASSNYHLCLNSGIGIDACVDIIKKYCEYIK